MEEIIKLRTQFIHTIHGLDIYFTKNRGLELVHLFNEITVPPLHQSISSIISEESEVVAIFGIQENVLSVNLFYYFDSIEKSFRIISYWLHPETEWLKNWSILLLYTKDICLSTGISKIQFRYNNDIPGQEPFRKLLSKLGTANTSIHDHHCIFEKPEKVLTSPWFNRGKSKDCEIVMWKPTSVSDLSRSLKSDPQYVDLRPTLNPLTKIHRLLRSHSAVIRKGKRIMGWCITHHSLPKTAYVASLYSSPLVDGWMGMQMLRTCIAHHHEIEGYYVPFTFSVEGINDKMESFVERVFKPLGVKEEKFYLLTIDLFPN